METISFNPTFTTEAIIAIGSIIVTILIAIIGGIYKITTNTKKYELTENYRRELLQWYASVISLMIKIIRYSESGVFFSADFTSQKEEMLSQLSALVEVGRFYFPNVIKNDGFGDEKPSAYKGYRHLNLEFLLYFYNIASNCVDGRYVSLLWKLERNFTSVIFDMIDPRKRNNAYSKYLALTIPEGKSIEDFLDEDPHNRHVFMI